MLTVSLSVIYIESDPFGVNSIAGIARTRPGNASSNFIEIESVSGSILANRLIGIDVANGIFKKIPHDKCECRIYLQVRRDRRSH